MNNYSTWRTKVNKIAQVKYEISEDVMSGFDTKIELAYQMNWSPIRTVEFVAKDLFN